MNTEEPTTTKLYRHFDKEGALLYVGISLNALNRLAQHKAASGWFEDIHKVEIETFVNRVSALNAERTAIETEKPKWNKKHNKPKEVKLSRVEATAEAARKALIREVVFKPMYSIEEAAHALSMRPPQVRRLILCGELGFVIVPPHREGWKEQVRITGWQLIDYIENAEQKAKKPYDHNYRLQLAG